MVNPISAVYDFFAAMNKNAARDSFYMTTLEFLTKREFDYYQAQAYIQAVDSFYTDLYNSKGKVEPEDERQYAVLMAEINKRVTENPAQIVPQPVTVPGNVIADIQLPQYEDVFNKVEGYFKLALGLLAAGTGFYIYTKFKK